MKQQQADPGHRIPEALDPGEPRLRAELMARIAHGLRSPLTVLKGTLADVEDPTLSAEERNRSVLLSHRAVDRLMLLSERLALASQLEHGLASYPQSVNIGPVIRSSVDRICRLEPRRDVQVALTVPDELRIRFDPLLLPIAVVEIVSNGLKHAKKQVWVSVSAQQLVVEDDGDGVTEAIRRTLFQSCVTRHARAGVGIGLWLAHGLFAAQGMDLSLSAAPGGGQRTCFTVRWPSTVAAT